MTVQGDLEGIATHIGRLGAGMGLSIVEGGVDVIASGEDDAVEFGHLGKRPRIFRWQEDDAATGPGHGGDVDAGQERRVPVPDSELAAAVVGGQADEWAVGPRVSGWVLIRVVRSHAGPPNR